MTPRPMPLTPRKKCACCQQKLALAAFGRNRRAKDGLHYYCKKCAALRQRDWATNNPETVRSMREAYIRKVHESNAERDPYAVDASS